MKITIKHNHGILQLENCTIEDVYGVRSIVGTVVSGSTTNRLLHITGTVKEVKGSKKIWPIYSKQLNEQTDGTYYINTEFL